MSNLFFQNHKKFLCNELNLPHGLEYENANHMIIYKEYKNV